MTELHPGWPLLVEESARNHWIGAVGDVVVIFAYEGSHDDVRHVNVGAALIERIHRERGSARLLFVLPPRHGKPPTAEVRSALAQFAKRFEAKVRRASAVVAGTGFGASVQRGAITGLFTLLRPKVPFRVEGTLRAGLEHLLEADLAPLPALLRFCEERLQGPPPA